MEDRAGSLLQALLNQLDQVIDSAEREVTFLLDLRDLLPAPLLIGKGFDFRLSRLANFLTDRFGECSGVFQFLDRRIDLGGGLLACGLDLCRGRLVGVGDGREQRLLGICQNFTLLLLSQVDPSNPAGDQYQGRRDSNHPGPEPAPQLRQIIAQPPYREFGLLGGVNRIPHLLGGEDALAVDRLQPLAFGGISLGGFALSLVAWTPRSGRNG